MKMNDLATVEDFAKLNQLIENEDVTGIKQFFTQVIETRYGAGKQETHLRSLSKIMIQYEQGMWSKQKRKLWAIDRMISFYGHVAKRTC